MTDDERNPMSDETKTIENERLAWELIAAAERQTFGDEYVSAPFEEWSSRDRREGLAMAARARELLCPPTMSDETKRPEMTEDERLGLAIVNAGLRSVGEAEMADFEGDDSASGAAVAMVAEARRLLCPAARPLPDVEALRAVIAYFREVFVPEYGELATAARLVAHLEAGRHLAAPPAPQPPKPEPAPSSWNWCPYCRQLVDADDIHDGSEVNCLGCSRTFVWNVKVRQAKSVIGELDRLRATVAGLREERDAAFDAIDGEWGDADATDEERGAIIVAVCGQYAEAVRLLPEWALDPECGTLAEGVRKLLSAARVAKTGEGE